MRRTVLFIEESIDQGTNWAAFEPNAQKLWAEIRVSVAAFMNQLFRLEAFQGNSPKEAYFVHCDATTTTETDIAAGLVNILVGVAPLKPAEFVEIRIQQRAGTPADGKSN